LVKDIRTDGEERLHTYYADDALVIENLMTATVTGQFLGIPGTASRSGSASCTSSSFEMAGSPGRTSGWTPLRWLHN
jgi:hypothetical protein